MLKNTLLFIFMASSISAFSENSEKVTKPSKDSLPMLVQTVVNKGNSTLVIPFKMYKYPNGLTLIVHEDHTDPIVHVDVTYHVGSARELVGRSGFAHFFEHMMFQGSDNVGDDEHFKIIQESGGTLNGTTNRDRTNYFETLPSNQLETALWLEADRMGFLLDAVTKEKFEIQRATVKNERGQNYDNRPYGLVSEKIGEAMYPFGHPYSWLTIGYIEDLDAATVDDLKNFFLRWYGPNNAVLTVSGDVNTEEVTKLVAKYFGGILKCPEVNNLPKQPVQLNEDRYISYEDNIRFPLTSVNFPTVPIFDNDEPALDVLSNILGGGKNSIFYKNFVKAQKAIQASVSHPCSELAGNMTFSMVTYPNIPLSDIHEAFRSSLKEFEVRGVTEDDILKVKSTMEAMFIEELETVSGKASKLASYYTFLGQPDYVGNDLERYRNVTPEDVMRVYNTYIKDKAAVILTAYPKGQQALVYVPDNAARKEIPAGYVNNLKDYTGLSYLKAKDDFDRSKRPLPGPNPFNKVPNFWRSTLSNNIPVIGAELDEVPAVSIQLVFKGGHLLENPSNAGIARLMSSMLGESTEKYSAEQMSDELDKLGSSISVNSGTEDVTVEVFSLTRNLSATMGLLSEKLLRPKFDSVEFERNKKLQLEGILNQVTQAATIASNVNRSLLYGKDNILNLPDIGTETSVGAITLDDVKRFYDKQISANLARITVVGEVSQNDFLDNISFLSEIPDAGTKMPNFIPAVSPENTIIYFVDKKGAAQSEIRLSAPGLRFDATGDYYKSGLMNYSLGNAFNCRINMNLREDKGLTYGTRAGFSGSKNIALYGASGGFKSEGTDVAVSELLREISAFRQQGILPEEWLFTQNAIGQRDALKYESLSQKAGFLGMIAEYGLDKSYVDLQKEILLSLTQNEINQLADKYLPVNFNIIVVGDKTQVWDKLTALGYPMVELDSDGNAIGN